MDKDEKKEAKLREKQRKEREKLEEQNRKEIIREEKERVRNSFGHKIKVFFWTLIFAIILVVAGFFGLKYLLDEKQSELYEEKMQYYYEQGEEALNNEKYEDAISYFEKIEESSSLYEDAQGKIEEATEKYLESYIEVINIYIGEGEFDKALDVYYSFTEEMQSSEKALEAVSNVQIARIEKNIESYETLYDQLSNASVSSIDTINDYVEGKIDEYVDSMISKYCEEVISELSSETYSEYNVQVEELLKLYSDSEELISLQEKINEYKPTDLLSMKYDTDGSDITVSSGSTKAKDADGNSYSNYILVNEGKEVTENTIEWNLDGSYTSLTGTVALSESVDEITSTGVKMTVYGDDKVIYKSKKIKSGTALFNFNIDITGVETLKIVLESDEGISYIIANPSISK